MLLLFFFVSFTDQIRFASRRYFIFIRLLLLLLLVEIRESHCLKFIHSFIDYVDDDDHYQMNSILRAKKRIEKTLSLLLLFKTRL